MSFCHNKMSCIGYSEYSVSPQYQCMNLMTNNSQKFSCQHNKRMKIIITTEIKTEEAKA